MNRISMTITWDGPPRIEVEHVENLIEVVVHAGLSERQIEEACNQLEPDQVREQVLEKWRSVMGITSRAEAM